MALGATLIRFPPAVRRRGRSKSKVNSGNEKREWQKALGDAERAIVAGMSFVYIALVLFCINGLGFGLAALTLSPRYAGIERFYKQYGRRIIIADMQLTMVLLAFLWLGVVGAI